MRHVPGGLWRTRWAAIGAAVAVTLGAGSLAVARASVSSGPRLVFVPVTPCRVTDTRGGSSVGPRNTPVGVDEQYEIQITGQNGNCTIPGDAAAVVLNVTAVSPSGPGFLTVWPADAALPNASNLNYVGGQAPTPNMVTTPLSATGAIKVFASAASIDLIIDVDGYFVDHTHDDRYSTGGTVTTVTAAPPTSGGQSPSFEGNTVRLVGADGTPAGNGSALRSMLNGLVGPAVVRLAPGTFDLGASGIVVPDRVALEGNGQMVTTITSAGSPIVSTAGNSELSNFTITGSGGASAGIRTSGSAAQTVRVHDVTLSLGAGLGSVDSRNSRLYLEHVTARSGYGVNNDAAVVTIRDSDLDNLVQNGASGRITARDTTLSPAGQFTAGAIAYLTGTIVLDNVDIVAQAYGIWDFSPSSTIRVTNSRIDAPNPRTPGGAATVQCVNVVRVSNYSVLSSSCL